METLHVVEKMKWKMWYDHIIINIEILKIKDKKDIYIERKYQKSKIGVTLILEVEEFAGFF